jgi:diguanylate cyclase (GGDEF)-like protein
MAVWLLCLAASVSVSNAAVADTALELQWLASEPLPDVVAATGAAQAEQFEPFDYRRANLHESRFWVRLRPRMDAEPASMPTLNIRHGRQIQLLVYALHEGKPVRLDSAVDLPDYRGTLQSVYALPDWLTAQQPLYARVEAHGRGPELLRFNGSNLASSLARGAEHAGVIALSFGALIAMALAATAIWFVLADQMFIMYALLISLLALYIAYLSGQGFEWPLLSLARPLTSFAWNVPVALSGAVACLFVRDIADLRRYLPRAYGAFGVLAIVFVALAFANLARLAGFGRSVTIAGNVVFLMATVLTLSVAFVAWRRGSRAAGWFLIAWALFDAFTIATTLRLLEADGDGAESLLFYGLPLSMVASAILIALGVADRLRQQRTALTEAERHAQLDPLTGVLNRRSLAERLDAACLRAQARGLPITLLFIDLDHFKLINDTYGHQAGDACLRAIIPPMQAELRQSDVIGRYGGEEFVVILSSADAAIAYPIAQRILARVADVRVEGYGSAIQLTCSIGVAASDKLGVWGEQLLWHADAAVYLAKRSGRNCVQLAQPLAA